MNPYFKDHLLTIYQGDCREVLKELPDEHVQCVVTSPPYWGLRDYGLDPVVWGGDPECDHVWGEIDGRKIMGGHSGGIESSGLSNSKKRAENTGSNKVNESRFCVKCGAWLGCLGLEPTPHLYVDHLVEIFREVRRVLRKDGTVWLNLGDSYAGSGGAHASHHPGISNSWKRSGVPHWGSLRQPGNYLPPKGLKEKDLVGVPWRVAFSLQNDDWWLRSDIIWEKPNPMPESVRDRPTKSHEYIFLLAKSEHYFYDIDSIREPHMTEIRTGIPNRSDGWKDSPATPREGAEWRKDSRGVANRPNDYFGHKLGRNKRSVWAIPTQPFPDAHFAVFPPNLIEPCIKAGSGKGHVVFDPFAGSGTTGVVAKSLGRKVVLIEPKKEYCEMIKKRTKKVGSLYRWED